MPSEAPEDQKPPLMEVPVKSSMEILHELFETFDAEPPVIVKKEKSESPPKKSKKSKKKHKHKDKKEKKRKDKKRKRSESSDSEPSEIDLAEILIKQEKETHNKKIKIEGTELTFSLKDVVKAERSSEKSEEKAKEKEKKKKDKIQIKLKTKELMKSKNKKDSQKEDGELSDSDRKKRKKDDEKKKKPKKSSSQEREELRLKIDDLRNKINDNHRHRSRSKDRERDHKRDKDGSDSYKRDKESDFYKRDKDSDFYKREKDSDFYKREKEGDFYRRDKDRDRERRDRDKYKEYDHKSRRPNPFYKEEDFYRGADLGTEKDDRRDRDRHRHDRDRRYRGRSRSRDDSSHIDKKKLLEIARKNAIQMMKSGSLPGAMTLGPQAQEKVIAAIKAGGKTIEELTDFCKTLSKKEELGDLSSNPDESDSDVDVPFHHPFQIKDRPTSITMNIKNSVPLPIKSTQERSTELRMQFPVSSGQLHRKTENEWVPVSPKKASEAEKAAKSSTAPATTGTAPLAIEAPPLPVPAPKAVPEPVPALPGPQLFPAAAPIGDATADISSIVSQRLTAIRKLQENPHDVQALGEMYRSNKKMQTWAQSKQQPGLFTGTTGVQILSQAELASGYQAWAKKDQLQSAVPVSGGMGMHLLQKMGWKPGEGLGKEKTGALEPLLLEVKLDKKGLVANEEQRKKKKQGGPTYTVKTLQNKHPVSLLGEYASKRKLGAPQYNLCFECGPDHKKNFVFQVVLNGVEYKPNIASPNKKEAKAAAATICLQELGLLIG